MKKEDKSVAVLCCSTLLSSLSSIPSCHCRFLRCHTNTPCIVSESRTLGLNFCFCLQVKRWRVDKIVHWHGFAVNHYAETVAPTEPDHLRPTKGKNHFNDWTLVNTVTDADDRTILFIQCFEGGCRLLWLNAGHQVARVTTANDKK